MMPLMRFAGACRSPNVVTAAITESPLLSAPTFRALVEAADAELVLGSQAWMDREALSLIVAAMSLLHVLDRLSLMSR